MRGKDVLQAVYADPERAVERRERAKKLFTGDKGEAIRRRSIAVRRGVDVPPELETNWKALRAMGLSAAEAANSLGLQLDPELVAIAKRARKRRGKKRGKTK